MSTVPVRVATAATPLLRIAVEVEEEEDDDDDNGGEGDRADDGRSGPVVAVITLAGVDADVVGVTVGLGLGGTGTASSKRPASIAAVVIDESRDVAAFCSRLLLLLLLLPLLVLLAELFVA